MASEERDGEMFDLAIAITCLLKYVNQVDQRYDATLNALSDKVWKELNIQIQKNKELQTKVTDDEEKYKLLWILSDRKGKELEYELEIFRHTNVTYEKKWGEIVRENQNLKDKAEQLSRKNTTLVESLQAEAEKHATSKRKATQTLEKSRKHRHSYITALEEKDKESQNKIIELNVKHERAIQEKERQLYQQKVKLQKALEKVNEKDAIITSKERCIEGLCQQMKDLEIKLKTSIPEEHVTNDLMEKNHLLDSKYKKLSDGIENVLQSLHATNMQMDEILSLLKTQSVTTVGHVLSSCTKDKDNELIVKQSTLKEIASAIKSKVEKVHKRIVNKGLTAKLVEDQLAGLSASNQKQKSEQNGPGNEQSIGNICVMKQLDQNKADLSTLHVTLKHNDFQLTQLTKENSRLEKQQKQERQIKFDSIINSNDKQIQDLKEEIVQRDAKIETIEGRIADKSSNGRENMSTTMKKEISDLKKQLEHVLSKLPDTDSELDETKSGLSEAIGDRLTDNNPNITDLSDRNRPTRLVEKCAELYDNQWTDAFEVLQKYFQTEETVIKALLHILQMTMTFCQDKAKHQIQELGRALTFSDKHIKAELSPAMYKLLKDERKAIGASVVENLQKMYISHLRNSPDHTLQKALEIREFSQECLEMCWLMIINDPPLTFVPVHGKGTVFNSNLYKPYTSSGTHVEYVVWPALLLHEGGPVLAKGVAQGSGKSKK